MKYIILLIAAALLSFCADNENRNIDTEENITNRILSPELQPIFDSLDVVGSVLIYDLKNDTFYSNDFKWAQKGKLPASTFKIANSIIALETGVVKSDSSLFKWDGEKRFMKEWEQDLILRDAFHFSCVPCYQDIARKIGEERMNSYLTKLNYGDMRVNSSNNATACWMD